MLIQINDHGDNRKFNFKQKQRRRGEIGRSTYSSGPILPTRYPLVTSSLWPGRGFSSQDVPHLTLAEMH